MEKATLGKDWRVATSKQKPEGIQPVKEGHREPAPCLLGVPPGRTLQSTAAQPVWLKGSEDRPQGFSSGWKLEEEVLGKSKPQIG